MISQNKITQIFSFFQNISRIAQPEYIPNVTDVIMCRLKTTGIVEIEFEINGYKYKFVTKER